MKHCTSSPKRVSVDDQENMSTLPLVESAALDAPGNNGVHSDAELFLKRPNPFHCHLVLLQKHNLFMF